MKWRWIPGFDRDITTLLIGIGRCSGTTRLMRWSVAMMFRRGGRPRS